MTQTARIISTYTADVSGVNSALFELGGMTVMHDASGCNSTYNTHDEPRWYDHDSLVFLSGISEMEAIMGDDDKLIRDIVSAAQQLHPRFIAIAGTPIPMMIGTDFRAIAAVVERKTGIPSFGFATNGMHTYVQGASMALAGIAERFVTEELPKTDDISVNLLGVTPLDFSVNGSAEHLRTALEQRGISVVSNWAMGDDLETLQKAPSAHVNLVVSYAGMGAAKVLRKRFGIPYVTARPYGDWTDTIVESIRLAAKNGDSMEPMTGRINPSAVVIGEGVSSVSLANAVTYETGIQVRAVAATEIERSKLGVSDCMARDEDELMPLLQGAEFIIADPLYEPICPKTAKFIRLPHEGFSGRIFRSEIPDMTEDISYITQAIAGRS
ncbi:MAG: oxidoreductase [Oscillospiraceae bacterium]|nr:oxidoreductase [Oscillospiraceae bacterium]